MKKTYMAPQMEEEKMMEVLPLCGSGVTGGSVIEDVGFGGTDNGGVLDPGAKIRVGMLMSMRRVKKSGLCFYR